VSPWRLTACQSDQLLFHLPGDLHFARPRHGPPRVEGCRQTCLHERLPDAVDGGQPHVQRLGNFIVGLPHAFPTRICLQQNAGMEQLSSGPLARRNHFSQKKPFLIRQGDEKFGQGASPSPQITSLCEKENRS
jgi:hypothetical protein